MSGHQRSKTSFFNIHYGNLKDIHIVMSFLFYIRHCIDSYPSCILFDLHSDPMQWQLLSPYLQIRESRLNKIVSSNLPQYRWDSNSSHSVSDAFNPMLSVLLQLYYEYLQTFVKMVKSNQKHNWLVNSQNADILAEQFVYNQTIISSS